MIRIRESIKRNKTSRSARLRRGVINEKIGNKEQREILKVFDSSNQTVLDSYVNRRGEFVVECDNTNSLHLSRLEDNLMKKVAMKMDLGFFSEANGNGLYGYTYTFHEFDD